MIALEYVTDHLAMAELVSSYSWCKSMHVRTLVARTARYQPRPFNKIFPFLSVDLFPFETFSVSVLSIFVKTICFQEKITHTDVKNYF